MNELNKKMQARYSGDFLAEVIANVEKGEMVSQCMQCGACSGSCPMGPQGAWEHPPQELFMMIFAGQREEVLSSSSMWMCTSCYNCVVRCPRHLPVTDLMHGLAHYGKRLGLSPKYQPTAKFGGLFWKNLSKTGRINELKLGMGLYFMSGFVQGIKNMLKASGLGMGMVKAKRINPSEAFSGHRVKDTDGFLKMMQKAKILEDERLLKE